MQTLPQMVDKVDIILPTPKVEGYRFYGWFDNDEGIGNAIKVIDADKVTEELVIYAVWVKEE